MPTKVPPSRLDSTKDFSFLVPAAFAQANAAFLQANNSTDTWVRTQANNAYNTANSAESFANAAFTRANAAYAQANTGGGGSGTSNSVIIWAITDDTSNITVSSSRASFRAPSAMTLISIPRATLNVASTSGVVNVDIKLSGTTILGSNKLTIDANEKTSTTADTPTTYVTTSVTDDTEFTVDILGAGTGAKGLKVILYYT